jgi:predicted ArsR family transcriptional regulator
MSVATTSRTAYESIKDKLGARQLAVYEAIREMGTATNEQISDYLELPINRVTGRVTELNKYGMLNIEGLGKNKSGFSAKVWSVSDTNDRKLTQLTIECGV